MFRSFAFAAVLLLGGCALPDEPPLLMTTREIRSQLFGHQLESTAPDGTHQLIRFGRGDRAEIIGEDSEFARWYADPAQGLCLQQHELPPRCAPLYATYLGHYLWGDTRLDDLTVRVPGFGQRDFDRRFRPRL